MHSPENLLKSSSAAWLVLRSHKPTCHANSLTTSIQLQLQFTYDANSQTTLVHRIIRDTFCSTFASQLASPFAKLTPDISLRNFKLDPYAIQLEITAGRFCFLSLRNLLATFRDP